MSVLVTNLIVMVVMFFASVGLALPGIQKADLVFSDHATKSHSNSKYNALTIARQLKRFSNGKKSDCDDVQVHVCTKFKNCYSPHAKIVCVNSGWKNESTILILSMKNFVEGEPIVVTGYKIANSRLLKQIINDRCITISFTWLKEMFSSFDGFVK
jgi:hypothetical protein